MESEIIPEGASNYTEDMYIDVSAHHYENVVTMDETLESASVSDEQNK